MPSGYHHLTTPERCQIYALKASGYSLRAIAREMSRSHSTISRELRRNSGGRGDRHQQAERTAQERRRQASLQPWKMTEALWAMIVTLLRMAWSPEQIAGRLRLEGVVAVSPEWIYQLIRRDRKGGGGGVMAISPSAGEASECHGGAGQRTGLYSPPGGYLGASGLCGGEEACGGLGSRYDDGQGA